MKTIEQSKIKKLSFPVSGYNYNVQILRSVDGGETFAYCGSAGTAQPAPFYEKNITMGGVKLHYKG